MNFNNYTIKAQEAVQKAADVAKESGQQAIETGHLLKAMLETTEEDLIPFMLKKLGVNVDFLNTSSSTCTASNCFSIVFGLQGAPTMSWFLCPKNNGAIATSQRVDTVLQAMACIACCSGRQQLSYLYRRLQHFWL